MFEKTIDKQIYVRYNARKETNVRIIRSDKMVHNRFLNYDTKEKNGEV